MDNMGDALLVGLWVIGCCVYGYLCALWLTRIVDKKG